MLDLDRALRCARGLRNHVDQSRVNRRVHGLPLECRSFVDRDLVVTEFERMDASNLQESIDEGQARISELSTVSTTRMSINRDLVSGREFDGGVPGDGVRVLVHFLYDVYFVRHDDTSAC